MAGINAGDVVQFKLYGRIFEQQTINVFNYVCTDASVQSTYLAAIQNATEFFASGTNNPTLAIIAAACPQWTLEYITGQVVAPMRMRFWKHTVNEPGTFDGVCESPNQAATIEKWSSVGGRKGVGSTHLAGVPTNGMEDGRWGAAYLAALVTVGNRIKSIYDPALGGGVYVPIITGKTFTPANLFIQGTIVQSTVRVMRRRTIGVGR